jgi:hypothetical protein
LRTNNLGRTTAVSSGHLSVNPSCCLKARAGVNWRKTIKNLPRYYLPFVRTLLKSPRNRTTGYKEASRKGTILQVRERKENQ